MIESCIEIGFLLALSVYSAPKLCKSINFKRPVVEISSSQQKYRAEEVEPEPLIKYRMVERFDSYNSKQRFTAQYKRAGQKEWTDIDYWWDKAMTLDTIKEHKKSEARRIEAEIRSKEPPVIHEIP